MVPAQVNLHNDPAFAPRAGSEENGDSHDAENALVHEPGRNFTGLRRAFLILLIAAIVLPLVYVSASAISDLNDRKQAAASATSRIARIAEEHAIKVFDLNQSFNERVIDALGTLSDDDIQQGERRVHDRLRQLSGGYPQVASVSVFGRNGRLLANSVTYPVPPLQISHTHAFKMSRNGALFDVSAVHDGTMIHRRVFTTSFARTDAHGAYNGTVAVALLVRYFYDFYHDLAGNQTALSIGLARDDGSILVHYPPEAEAHGSAPAGFVSAPSAMSAPASQPLTNRADDREMVPEAGHPSGIEQGTEASFHKISALLGRLINHGKEEAGAGIFKVEDSDNVVAYRRVAGYPIYVFASYPMDAVLAGWYRHVGLLAAGVFIPCIVLWGVIIMSLRRLRFDERAYLAWQKEAATRRAVEAAFRQARRMQALGTLVGSVAHDFNNLLMTMSANAQIVRRRGAAEVETELAAIERAIKMGKRLTRQLLGVARKQPHRTEVIAVQSWLARAQPLIAAALGAQVTLILKIDPAVWPFKVDGAELELALMNVALNARDAMPDGGCLTIEAENLHLGDGQAFAHGGDYVRISLIDTGKGMPPEVLRRAFEPLFTTKPLGMGTGLGLPQVSGFCEQSGGTATLESEEGRGTTVRLYLPRAVQVPGRGTDEALKRAPSSLSASASRVADTPQRATRSLHILLVEDNPEVAAGTEALLGVMGHQAYWIENADSAYAYLSRATGSEAESGSESEAEHDSVTHAAQHATGSTTAQLNALPQPPRPDASHDSHAPHFDLVLSDIHMPGKMNGIDLALALRESHVDLPVILVTGYASELERARLAHVHVLSKPFDVEVLESLIHEVSVAPAREVPVANSLS